MGSALAQGWSAAGLTARFVVVRPRAAHYDRLMSIGAETYSRICDIPDDFIPDIVVIAVKPTAVEAAIAPLIHTRWGDKPLFLSVVAGRTLSYFSSVLGPSWQSRLVRAMPNITVSIQRGVTVLAAMTELDDMMRMRTDTLMSAVGKTIWVDDEPLLDIATAISGSGPAYVFFMIEALIKAAIDAGLPAELADQLTRLTVAGAGDLAARAVESPDQLRAAVTSPRGVTDAAMTILSADSGLVPLIQRAVAEACKRSHAL